MAQGHQKFAHVALQARLLGCAAKSVLDGIEQIERGLRAQAKTLRAARWRVLVVWECETKNAVPLTRRLRDFLA